MNKTEFIELVEGGFGSEVPVAKVINMTLETIADSLSDGDEVNLTGFGKFSTKYREPRKGRNPLTGEEIDISGKHVPHFKPGAGLKESVL